MACTAALSFVIISRACVGLSFELDSDALAVVGWEDHSRAEPLQRKNKRALLPTRIKFFEKAILTVLVENHT